MIKITKFIFAMTFVCMAIGSFSQNNIAHQAISNIRPGKNEVWQSFEERHGHTIINWKETTKTPHRIICTPIKLASSIESKGQLEKLLRNFIQENNEVFRMDISGLMVASIHKANKIWYAQFAQTYKGMEVLGSEIVFRVHENGHLFVFGFDYYWDIDIPTETPDKTEEIGQELQQMYANRSQGKITVTSNPAKKILPWIIDGKRGYVMVQVFKVSNDQDINDMVLVNLQTNKIEQTIDKTRFAELTGNVKSSILPLVATDTVKLENLENMIVSIDGNEVMTDEFGNFSFTLPGPSATLTAHLKGAYVDVANFNLPNATITQTVQQNDVVNLVWDDSNSDMAERNVFYHINIIHAYNKNIDPNFTNLDYPLQCIVNDYGTNAPCNAFWNGANLHFGIKASACAMNSAHGASVVYHEYGHAINDKLYIQLGQPLGLKNPTLHEAFADIYACLLVDDPRFALGWFGPGTFTRNLNNNNTYPGSVVGQQHTDGLILGGAFWDLRLLTSPETAYALAHYAKYGTPDDSDLGMAYSEVYLETLIADDDDGNLLNGTPNGEAIENAFCQHGIGSGLFAVQQVNHTPHENTLDTTNDYHIEISLPDSPFISGSMGNMELVYSTDNFGNTDTVLFLEVNNTTFEAFIPAQAEGTLIKYYFSIPNGNCGTQLLHPSRDFMTENYSFYVGVYTLIYEDDFETDQGWAFGISSDNATSGIWERGNPQQTIDNTGFIVQPQDDHTADGTMCLVTGASQGGIWYANDVDGGKTSVVSPVFNNLNSSSIIEMHKWFVHGAGFTFPAQGRWKMAISNNGTDWVEIENTGYGDHRKWVNSKYKISDFVVITNQVQVRFEASDFGTGSIVEALVDDFSIITLDPSLKIEESPSHEPGLTIYPNPVSNMLTVISEVKTMESFTIYSVYGEKSISNKVPKTNLIDVSGLSPGIYFLEINSENGKGSQKFIKK